MPTGKSFHSALAFEAEPEYQMWARQLNDIDRNSQPLSNPDPTGKEREFFEALRKGIATDRKHVCY